MSAMQRASRISMLLLIAACQDPSFNPMAPTTPGPTLSKLPAAKPAPSTSIAMIVDDVATSGVYRIRSDGLGEYRNGVDGMQVEIDQYGNLQITPVNANSSAPPIRTLTFDYGAPIDPLNTYVPDASPQWNFKILSNKVNNGNPRIQDLGIGANPVGACYNVTIAHRTLANAYRDNFNVASDPSAGYVSITRTSVTPAQWDVISDGGSCAVNPNWAGVYSQDLTRRNPPLVSRGYYDQRFSLHLRAYP